jgi:hypothetical protein
VACTRARADPGGAAGGSAPPGHGSTYGHGIVLRPDVIVIERVHPPVVKRMDPDGSGYTLDGSAPGVAHLRMGKVMLVKNEAVGRVNALTHSAPRQGRARAGGRDRPGRRDQRRDARLDGHHPDPTRARVIAWNDPNAEVDISGKKDPGGSGTRTDVDTARDTDAPGTPTSITFGMDIVRTGKGEVGMQATVKLSNLRSTGRFLVGASRLQSVDATFHLPGVPVTNVSPVANWSILTVGDARRAAGAPG